VERSRQRDHYRLIEVERLRSELSEAFPALSGLKLKPKSGKGLIAGTSSAGQFKFSLHNSLNCDISVPQFDGFA
jgi:hypothetical protein